MQQNFILRLINRLNPDRVVSGNSTKWANWMSMLLPTSCQDCVEQHGKIVDISVLGDEPEVAVMEHPYCGCIYVAMRTKQVGTVTNNGMEGADAYLVYLGRLPYYYMDKATAEQAGWKKIHKKLSSAVPGAMIGGDVYNNDDLKLPSASGRIWREADINYVSGKRNRQRILYSNDGLLFATYDHYHTFYEITKPEE